MEPRGRSRRLDDAGFVARRCVSPVCSARRYVTDSRFRRASFRDWHMTCFSGERPHESQTHSRQNFLLKSLRPSRRLTIDLLPVVEGRIDALIAAGGEELTGRILIDTEVSMARSKFRRAPRFENLESRQLLSTGVSSQGPTNDAQYMLQLLNEARTDPSAAAQEISSRTSPPTSRRRSTTTASTSSATLKTISSATPQPPLAWNAAARAGRPGP